MNDTKKTIVLVAVVAIVAFIIGAAVFSAGLGELIPQGGVIASFIGTSAAGFGMKLCLIAVLGTVFLVPGVREQFTGSVNSGSDFKNASKKGRKGGI